MFTCFYYSVSVTFATFPLNAATVCVYRSEDAERELVINLSFPADAG